MDHESQPEDSASRLSATEPPRVVPQPPSAPLHTIRLRGAWDITSAPNGTTRQARNFGRPRTLDPHERLWLVCSYLPDGAEVFLNGERVAVVTAGLFAVDITDRLQTRNTVAFVVRPASMLLGEATLEVRLND